MIITSSQVLLISVGLGGLAGFRRGWAKEVIASAMVLGTLFFLTLGGDRIIGSFFTHGFNSIVALGNPTDPSGPAVVCSPGLQRAVSEVLFGSMTWLGYRTSAKHGVAVKSSNHRIAGLIPGGINGAAIAYFISRTVFPGTQVQINTPGQSDTSGYLPEVLVLGLVGLLVVLFITSQAGKGK